MLSEHRVHIAYDETRVVYDLGGKPDGPTVVLCDGLGCDGFIWKYLLEDLQKEYRLIHPNYRGHGRSQIPSNPDHMTIQDHCRDLLGILDEQGVDQCVLIGHSMGVQTILEFTHRNPKRVASLVTICGSYGRVLDTFHDSSTLRNIFPHAVSLIQKHSNLGGQIWKFLARNPASWPLAKLLEVNAELAHREDVMPYFNHLARMNPRIFMNALQSASQHSALSFLRDLNTPTLIIAGERDQFTPKWLSEKMNMHLSESELVIANGASHIAPLESPKEINSEIIRFLAEQIGTGANASKANNGKETG